MKETPKKIPLAYVGPERRRYRRLTEALPVKFKIITKDKLTPSYDGITENISMGGIFLDGLSDSARNLLDTGTKLALEIDIPNVSDPVTASGEVTYIHEIVETRGEVRWVRKKPEQLRKPGVGIRFIEISDKDRAKIVDYIRFVEYVKRKIF